MPRWYLEEQGIGYDLVELDLRGNQHRQPDYLQVNPFGKLPALVDTSVQAMDGTPLKLFESGAILLHLAEHHAGQIKSAAERSLTAQWLLFGDCPVCTQQSGT
jgi:glutathione S-transferase